MHNPDEKTIAGILVGSILHHSAPLIMAVFAEPDGEHTIRVSLAEGKDDSFDAAKKLVAKFYPAGRGVWANDSMPTWYYIQLDLGHPPMMLYGWSLPNVAQGLWIEALADTHGLVRCAISPHVVDGSGLDTYVEVVNPDNEDVSTWKAAPL